MSYKKKIELESDKAINLGGDGNPTKIEGYYLGAKTIQGGAYGPSVLHIFQTKTGNVGVWARGNLNRLLESHHAGQMCLVEFTGMRQPSKKGQRPSYQHTLSYDDTNTIDMGSIAGSSGSTSQASDEEEGYGTTASLEEEYESAAEEELEEVSPPRPIPPARAANVDPARQARVQAMLNGTSRLKTSVK